MPRPAPLLLIPALAALVAGCDSGDWTLDEVDPAAAPRFPAYEEVAGIIERSCVPCHAGGRSPRLDSCEGIQNAVGDIIRVVEQESMPSGAWPRLTEREKLVLRNWVQNTGACAPCAGVCP